MSLCQLVFEGKVFFCCRAYESTGDSSRIGQLRGQVNEVRSAQTVNLPSPKAGKHHVECVCFNQRLHHSQRLFAPVCVLPVVWRGK